MLDKKRSTYLIGAICLMVAIWYGYPLIKPLFTSTIVNEAPLVSTISFTTDMHIGSEQSLPMPILKGDFIGFDRLHNGTGTAHITQTKTGYILRLEDNFKVTNGPDLYIGFGKDGVYIEGSEIATLKGNIGAQNYEQNTLFDTQAYNEVWIWCKRFSEPFARAKLYR